MSAGERNEPRRTMTDAQARWVREHAWTPAMRKTYTTTPALYSTCPCQHGPCGHCTAGHHDRTPPPQTKTNPTSTENATQTTIFDFL